MLDPKAKLVFILIAAAGLLAINIAHWQPQEGTTAPPARQPLTMSELRIVPAAPASAPPAIASAPALAAPAPASSPVAADASEPSAGEDEEEDCQLSYYGCPCPEKLSEIPLTAPHGLPLVSANCSTKGGDLFGGFYFKGEATVTGQVVREDNEMFGDTFAFYPNDLLAAGDVNKFAGSPTKFRVSDASEFQAPELSDTDHCWMAEVVVKVRGFHIVSGFTDEASSYLDDFDVVKVGKYHKCKAH